MTAGSLRAVFLLSGLALTTLGLALGCKDPVPKPSAAKSAKADATASAPSAYGLARYPKTPSAPAPVALPVGKGASVKQERYIVVDQFGYTPAMPKRAILVDPVSGWNGNDEYHPPKRMQVRHWNDSRVAFEGRTSVWNGGKVDPSAGDRGAWFDFSMLKKDGLYYVFDPKSSTRSDPFRIARNVYAEVLRAAVRMYYFNRANFEKKPPHSCVKQRCWSIGVDGLEPGQDGSARSVSDRENPATARDLRGGWWDAGDTNKYVTFAKDAVQQLLTAYDENPDVFGDDFGIPESGNSKPDLLDEVRIELEWLRRMQPRDLAGGVLLKVGAVELDNDLPDKSKTHRYYYPKPCSSATIAAAGMFAHAALVYGAFASDEAFAKDLRERAIRAWDAYQKQPKSDACDDGTIKSGDADRSLADQERDAVTAAVYLFALTQEARYDSYVEQHYQATRPFHDDRWSVYDQSQGDALMAYTLIPSANSEVKRAIVEMRKKQANTSDLFGFKPELSLYAAYMRPESYHWGSNNARAAYGNTNYDLVQYDIVPKAARESFLDRAAGMLHSFHGVNPMQLVYLSNMYDFGAERSVDEIFHAWFRDGDARFDNARTSKFGPAPGYVPGGPNKQYCNGQPPDHACSRSPIREQPPGKAYVDTNTGWKPASPFDKSWELSEPAIYYQASYVRLISKFVAE